MLKWRQDSPGEAAVMPGGLLRQAACKVLRGRAVEGLLFRGRKG